jgi:hypothetical protein
VDANRATNVPIDVTHANGLATINVNQQINGSIWFKIGTWTFNAGTGGNVLIRTDGTNGFVIGDAVRFVLPGAVSTTVQIVASDSIAGEFGSNSARVAVVRTGDMTQGLAVNLAYSGTAAAGTDFTGGTTVVTIPAGAVAQAITLSPVADSLAEGTETIEIALQPGAGYTNTSLANATISLQDRPFDAWRFVNFTPAELVNLGVSGAEADPDADGVNNFLERALVRTPKTPDINSLPVPAILSGNLSLTYTRLKSSLLDVNFTARVGERSGRDHGWLPESPKPFWRTTARSSRFAPAYRTPGAAQKFLRLRIDEK